MKKILVSLFIFVLLFSSFGLALPDQWGRGVDNPKGDITLTVKDVGFIGNLFSSIGLFTISGLESTYSKGDTIHVTTREKLYTACNSAYLTVEIYSASSEQQTGQNYVGGSNQDLGYLTSGVYKEASFNFQLPGNARDISKDWSISSYIYCSDDTTPASTYSTVTEMDFEVSGFIGFCSDDCNLGETICMTKGGYANRYIGECGSYDADICLEFPTSLNDLEDCGGIDLCSNGVCVSAPPTTIPPVTPTTIGPTIKDLEIYSIEPTIEKQQKGQPVSVIVNIKNYLDEKSPKKKLEVAIYKKSYAQDSGLITFTLMGRAGIEEIESCSASEEFVHSAELDKFEAGEEKTFVLEPFAPKEISKFSDGTTNWAGSGEYVIVAGLYDECGAGYTSFKSTPIQIVDGEVETHREYYGSSCVLRVGIGNDTCEEGTGDTAEEGEETKLQVAYTKKEWEEAVDFKEWDTVHNSMCNLDSECEEKLDYEVECEKSSKIWDANYKAIKDSCSSFAQKVSLFLTLGLLPKRVAAWGCDISGWLAEGKEEDAPRGTCRASKGIDLGWFTDDTLLDGIPNIAILLGVGFLLLVIFRRRS